MNVRVAIDFTVPVAEKHWHQMQQSAEMLTDTKSSVRVSQPRDNPRRLVVDFTIPKARQGDVVDRIGLEFWNWIEDYSDSSIGFGPEVRRPKNHSNQRKRRE